MHAPPLDGQLAQSYAEATVIMPCKASPQNAMQGTSKTQSPPNDSMSHRGEACAAMLGGRQGVAPALAVMAMVMTGGTAMKARPAPQSKRKGLPIQQRWGPSICRRALAHSTASLGRRR